MNRKKNGLTLKTRRNIYNFILKNPGVHYREICKLLKIRKTNVTYHLKYLIKKELVTENNKDGYTRYYVVKLEGEKEQIIAKILAENHTNEPVITFQKLFKFYTPGRQDKEIISILRQETIQKIVRFLYVFPNSTQVEISSFFGKHQTTISSYIKKLVEKNILTRNKNGKRIYYKLTDEDYIYYILGTYFNFREILNENGEPTGKYDYFVFDSIIDEFLDHICIPYCAGYRPWTNKSK